MPQVDVLVPTFNRRHLLSGALESLLNQTFSDFRVIIYDDGSTDGTVDALPRDPRIKVVRGARNRGVPFARNRLLDLIEAPFACWQDSDDVSHVERLERQLALLRRGEHDMAFSQMYFFRHPNPPQRTRTIHRIDVSRYTSREGLRNNMNFATGMFRAELARYRFDESLVAGREDAQWLGQLIRAGCRFGLLQEPLYYCRRHPGRMTYQRTEQGMQRIKAYWYGTRNWGDILTPLLVERLSGAPPIYSAGKGKHLVVGSVLHRARGGDTIWGTGAISPRHIPRPFPTSARVASVRGPLTRQLLHEVGMRDVPEVYGDPAFLAPALFDLPEPAQKRPIGVIPHYVDHDQVAGLEAPDLRIIDITAGLEPVVRAVLGCERIVSSSLHGVILGEAFGRPTRWIELGDRLVGGRFKFHDHYLGTGRDALDPAPVGPNLARSLRDAADHPAPPPVVDLDALLKACPFNRTGCHTVSGLRRRFSQHR